MKTNRSTFPYLEIERLRVALSKQHEANKTSLCVLCALLEANDWHPNMRKDIEIAISMNRAALHGKEK